MLTKELMTKNLITVAPDDSILKAWTVMSEEMIRHLVVMELGKIVGIMSDRDFLKAINFDETKKVKDFMSWPPMTVNEETPIDKIIEDLMLEKVSAFIVEDNHKKPRGIITTEDLLIYLYMLIRKEEMMGSKPLSDLIKPMEMY